MEVKVEVTNKPVQFIADKNLNLGDLIGGPPGQRHIIRLGRSTPGSVPVSRGRRRSGPRSPSRAIIIASPQGWGPSAIAIIVPVTTITQLPVRRRWSSVAVNLSRATVTATPTDGPTSRR